MKFNGCPRQAYFLEHSPEAAVQSRRDKADMSRISAGIQNDMLKSFPPGVQISGDYRRAAADTFRFIKEGASVIYGATFIAGSAACRCDVIMKNGDFYDLYTVRPTDRYMRYADEALYDKIIAQKSGLNCSKSYICAIDKKAHGNNILCVIDTDNPAKQKALREKLSFISLLSRQAHLPKAQLSRSCGSCPFFAECFDTGEESIFSLKSLNFTQKSSLWQHGVKTVSDYLALSSPSESVLREIRVRSSDEDVYDKDAIQAFLSQLSYPLGFLDFETAEVFVPSDPILSPMDTVITQFSYHLIEREGAEAVHFDFIGDGVTYPERDAAKELIRVIKPNHCVLMYSDYEKICIERLCRRLPEFSADLQIILSNLVDLEKPFAKKHLVNRRMEGKSSLKKVLPALYPGEKALSYSALPIKNGRMAESVYMRLPKMDTDERKRAVRDLREYNALDTLAMIKLLEKLQYYSGGD
ncbi:MAG: DUF2779 domain-containing protein [Clostridia bacterium]|nr:DUF2779 domain-containing protein [Clostridia bacterium]